MKHTKRLNIAFTVQAWCVSTAFANPVSHHVTVMRRIKGATLTSGGVGIE